MVAVQYFDLKYLQKKEKFENQKARGFRKDISLYALACPWSYWSNVGSAPAFIFNDTIWLRQMALTYSKQNKLHATGISMSSDLDCLFCFF